MRIAIVLTTALLLASTATAANIAYTSFEEPGTGDKYTDTGDAALDHDLVNNAGEAPVDFTSTGGEMGFDAYYYNTRNDVGLTDGDYVGVTTYTGEVGSFTDGTAGYQITDPDGMMEVTFDTVTLPGGAADVSIDYFVIDTGYEADPADSIKIWVETDTKAEIVIFEQTGDDLEGYGSWLTGVADLTGYSSATLKVAVDANASSEGLYIDNIVFTPEPASLLLIGLGALALRRR